MDSRVLKHKKTKITQGCSSSHIAVDLVGEENGNSVLDTITAHSSGKVIEVATGHVNEKGSTGMRSYGNYVQILHDNGYTTFYAHLKQVYVKVGDYVKKGQDIGYMGDSGNAYGSHLHFEIRKDKSYNSRINPTSYLNSDLPNSSKYSCKYRVYNYEHWYATTGNGKQAGNIRDNKGISGIQFKTYGGGYSIYQAYDNVLKCWLDEVCKWDDTNEGYAGIKGHDIGAFRIKTEFGRIRYRAYDGTLNKWLPWVTGYDTQEPYNGYAGILGHKILAIEVEFI